MLSNNKAFIEAFKEELARINYIYVAPMNRSGSWADIFYIFSKVDEELRIAKVYREPVDISNKIIYERDAQKLIQHKNANIVKFYDKGTIEYEGNEYFYLIEEHIKGKTLEEVEKPLFLDRPYKERILFFIQFLNGIAAYRDDFEIHNDLHFGNVLISEQSIIKEKNIKIIDPGSSRYTHKSGIEDYDLYLIKKQYLDFFFRIEELEQIGRINDLGKLSFYKLEQLFRTELEKEQEIISNDEIYEHCLTSIENVINFYFENLDEATQRPRSIPKENRTRIMADILNLNTYKKIANQMSITISGNWNPLSHGAGKIHEIFITVGNLIIKIKQHDFGETEKILATINGDLISDRGAIEIELETIAQYKKKKKIELLTRIKEKIHTDYPFDDIVVEYMDKSYYKYIDTKNWKDASNQILYKIKNETQLIEGMIKRLFSIKLFLELTELIEADLTSERFMPKDLYEISAKELAGRFNRQSPQYRDNLINELDTQIKNFAYISSQIGRLFTSKGIFHFLTDTQIELSDQFNNYFNRFNPDFLRSHIDIDTQVPASNYSVRRLEDYFKNLYKLIDKLKILGLINLLNEIIREFKEVERILL